MNWQTQILTPQAQALLPKLQQINILSQFHLVGGTGLSLYLGHRESVDFDFFTTTDFTARIVDEFKQKAHSLRVISRQDNSVEFILDNVKIFLWAYFYPLTQPLNKFQGINIASPLDIALMKIIALEGRVSWKDIIDLYFIDRQVLTIAELAKLFYGTYPQNEVNEYSRLKIIMDEKELEHSPKPKMLINVDFEEVKNTVYKKLMAEFAANIKLN